MLIWTLLQLMSLSWPLGKNEKGPIVIGGDKPQNCVNLQSGVEQKHHYGGLYYGKKKSQSLGHVIMLR